MKRFLTYGNKIKAIKQLIRILLFIVINVSLLIILPLNNANGETLTKYSGNELMLKSDSADSVSKDTNSIISPNALDSKVSYSAKDSIRFNVAKQKVFLYGNAEVKYQDITLKADKIELNADSSIVTAEGLKDSSGEYVGKPVFTQGDQVFTAYKMRYNFKTKKGKIYDVVTKGGGGFIHGHEVKRIGTKKLFIKDADYTTCDLEHPHFSIHASKLEVIPNDKIIVGPSYLKVAGIPTPLVLPFGIFPNHKGRSSGLLIPQYGESAALGFYLINGGYYWAINHHWDLALTGDIYTYGSWGAKLNSNYNVRYKYQGNVNLDFSNIITGIKGLPEYGEQKQFFVRWQHTQAAQARPNSRFSANVNAGTAKNFRDNFNSTSADYLTNTFTSSINYTKTFGDKPFSLSIAGRHSQNTQTGALNVSLPNIAFNISRIQPFQNFGKVGKGDWYKNLGFSYSMSFQNNINTYDSLVTENNLNNLLNSAQTGIQQNIPVQTTFHLFKYFNFNPYFNYTEKWYFKSIRENFDTTTNSLKNDTISRFTRGNMYNFGANMTFKLYGMAHFKGGLIRAIRHVMTPSIGFSFLPQNNQGVKTYYDPAQNKYIDYSIYQGSIFGAVNSNHSGFVTFNLLNNLQMKARDRKDTANGGMKKINLINSLNISTAYNIFADSLNWQDIQISGNTSILKNVTLNFAAMITPYRQDSFGNKLNESLWKYDQKLGRVTNADVSINFTLKSKKAKNYNPNDYADDPNVDKSKLKEIENHPNAYVNFNIPWVLNVQYNLNYSRPNPFQPRTLTHTIGLNGNINVTPKWKIAYQTNYDFVHGEFSYTTFDIYRDLHCWELSFDWVPFGLRKSYRVQLNVKASTLQDLKLVRKKEYYDFNDPTFN